MLQRLKCSPDFRKEALSAYGLLGNLPVEGIPSRRPFTRQENCNVLMDVLADVADLQNADSLNLGISVSLCVPQDFHEGVRPDVCGAPKARRAHNVAQLGVWRMHSGDTF